MSKPTPDRELAILAEKIQDFVRSGGADAALADAQPDRERALEALEKAEQIDPRKLRRTVSL